MGLPGRSPVFLIRPVRSFGDRLIITMRPYFAPSVLKSVYDGLPSGRKAAIRNIARTEAETRRTAADISPGLYAVMGHHFASAGIHVMPTNTTIKCGHCDGRIKITTLLVLETEAVDYRGRRPRMRKPRRIKHPTVSRSDLDGMRDFESRVFERPPRRILKGK